MPKTSSASKKRGSVASAAAGSNKSRRIVHASDKDGASPTSKPSRSSEGRKTSRVSTVRGGRNAATSSPSKQAEGNKNEETDTDEDYDDIEDVAKTSTLTSPTAATTVGQPSSTIVVPTRKPRAPCLGDDPVNDRQAVFNITSEYLFPKVKFLDLDGDLQYSEETRTFCNLVFSKINYGSMTPRQLWWQNARKWVYSAVSQQRNDRSNAMKREYMSK